MDDQLRETLVLLLRAHAIVVLQFPGSLALVQKLNEKADELERLPEVDVGCERWTMKCLIHKGYEPAVRPADGCLRCWVVWLERQGRLERSLNPADLACIMLIYWKSLTRSTGGI